MFLLYAFIAAALIFAFMSGLIDSSNIVATVISSRALPPRVALLMTAAAEFIAPFLFGVAVASTLGEDLLDPQAITLPVVLAAVLAAILWNVITWLLGIPSSSSHALVGGLLGAAILAQGLDVIQLDGLVAVGIGLFLSPPLSLLVGFLLMHLILTVFKNAGPSINLAFKRAQIVTALGLALSHGANDPQKTMGIITMGLVTAGFQETFRVPLWVIAISAGAFALGTASGGWRLIRTLGGRIYKIRPVHAFTSQSASAGVILGASLLGWPVSTTQVVSSSIMGVGAAERLNKVRWQIAQSMVLTWVLTIPLTGLVAALLLLVFNSLLA